MPTLNSNMLNALHICLMIGTIGISGCATTDKEKEIIIPIATDKAALGDIEAKSFYSTRMPTGIATYKQGDVADVTIFNETGLSGKYLVDYQGNANFPYIGSVQIAGLTNVQLQERLTQLYGQDYFQNPNILVNMEASEFGQVIIDGAVSKPGVIELSNPIKLTEAIARAGGLEKEGDSKSVFVVRQKGETRTPFRIDLDAVRLAQAPDPVLLPSDVVFIQKEGDKFEYEDILRTIPLLNFALIAATRL